MRRVAGRLQTLGAGVLVLAATVTAPALSAAQQGAADTAAGAGGAEPGVSEPPLTEPPAPPAQADPGAPVAGQQGAAGSGQEQVQSQGVVQSPPAPPAAPEAAPQKSKLAKSSAAVTVSIGDNFYSPSSIAINVGDTVTWKNNGAAPHSATADNGSFDTGVFNGGQSRSKTFTTAGTIPYFCTVHGQAQSGTIEVVAAAGGGGGGGSSAGTSEAAAVASSGAAGSSSSLPATGFAALILAAIGVALVGSGSLLRRLG